MKKAHIVLLNKNVVAIIFIAICTFIMSLMCSNNPFNVGYTLIDSSVFHYMANVILHGGMPYRDSFDHKGPLIYLIDAFGIAISNSFGVWLVEIAFIFAALYFSYKIARLLGCNRKKSMIVVAIYILSMSRYFQGGNLTEEYANTFILIALWIYLKYFLTDTVTQISLIACGLCFGAVCLLRINMIALWIIMCMGVLAVCMMKRKCGLLIKYVLLFVLGSAVIILPITLWLMLNHAFSSFIKDYFAFNFIYSNCSRADFFNAFNYFATSEPMIISIPILSYFCLKDKEIIDILCMAALLLSIWLLSISGYTYDHYGMVMVPFVVYAFSRVLKSVSLRKLDKAIIVSGVLLTLMVYSTIMINFKDTIMKVYKNPQYVKTKDEYTIAEIIKENTSEDDKITVCGNRDLIYLLSERMSSSLYSYQEPIAEINYAIREEYIECINNLSAKVIVIDKSSGFHDDFDSLIDKYYVLVETVGNTEIFLKND